ncbi:Caspase domain-containing protein [Lutibacter oricola]|uniref:Caspase domain-containing protein n=1 Tax=Lutibacter oricola TaxID=762486 RepID=A0A1H2X5G1_9FLAO|nr:caspase family protein [Lutibacter oricola]SDW87499.1 Caspase domain-containing protein [Lutibacter oricola]
MKSKLLLIVVLIYSSLFAQTNSNTIFEDNFYSNIKDWSEGSDEKRSFFVQDGYYYFSHKRDKNSWLAHQAMDIDSSKDFKIETKIKKVSGVQDYGFGLTFGRLDNDNEYWFQISGNGYYRILKYENGDKTDIKKWTTSSFIKEGNGAINNLTVEKSNNKYKFYINGSFVHSMPFSKLFGKRVGFVVNNKQKIGVDYIKAYYLNKDHNLFANNSTVFYEENFSNNDNDWLIGSSKDREYQLKNGKYYFEHKRKDGSWNTHKGISIDTSRDFKIESNIQKISGVQDNGYGIIFGRKDNDNEFVFLVTGNGSYKIYYEKEGKETKLVDWKNSSYVNKSNYANNKFTVTKIGSKLKFYLNDYLVHSTYFRRFMGNRLGWSVSSKQKISIDNLKITYLNKNTTTTSNTESYVLNDQFNNSLNSWKSTSTSEVSTYNYDNKYYINKKEEEKGSYFYKIPSIDTTRDFQIETEIKKLTGVQNTGYGLIFGRSDVNNQYLFNITANGHYRISKYDDGKYENLVTWTKTDHVIKGDGNSNILKIKKEEGKYKFYVNDNYLNYIPYKKFGNSTGFVVFGIQKVGVNYINIKYLDQKKKDIILVDPVVTDNIDRSKYHFYEDFNDNTNNWTVESKEEYTTTISGGRYGIEHKRNSGGWYFGKYKELDKNRDFEVETTIERKYSTDNGSVAFVFFRKDENNKHELFISKNGSYLLRKFVDSKKTILINWTESSAIATGYAPNIVKIAKIGSSLKLYINNQYLNKIEMYNVPGYNFGYTLYERTKINIDNFKIKYLNSDINYPPEIDITEPVVVSRGFKIVKSKKIKVIGKATDKDGIYEVTINGTDAYVEANGNFRAEVPLRIGDNELIVKASDIKGKSTTKKFFIKRESPEPTVIVDVNPNVDVVNTTTGNYYALLIGVSDYGDSKIVDLEGLPSKDATGLGNILTSKYNFKPENVKVLINATRSDILNAFDTFRKKITEKDNLLIFYAGHGVYEDDAEVGYWLPADADKEFTANWIQNSVIVSTIKRIKAKHTLLISDACFSGSIFKTRSLTKEAPKAYQKLYELPSKKAITSGTLKTVPNKSVFYKYLINRLTNNTSKYMSALELFSNIKTPVANNSPNVPQYGVIHGIGDEGGDFIFIKK